LDADALAAEFVVTDLISKSGSMNIVHVVESLDVGGLERVVLSLVAWQIKQGHRSRIVCLFHEGALADEARAMGINVVAVGKHTGFDWRAVRLLRSELSRGQPDVIHTHNAVTHYYTVLASVGLRLGWPRVRMLNTRHGMGSLRGSTRLDRLYRIALWRTHAAVSVCHAVQARFVASGVIPLKQARVVANGVMIDQIAPRQTAAKEGLMAQLGRAPGAVVLGTVGRLSPVKDHGNLLLAVRSLKDQGQPVELVVVGDGETRPALQAQAHSLGLADSVHFLGMRQDVAKLLQAFDVFVLSSISEGYSLALVEAAAAALPIVATRVGGNADIVHDEQDSQRHDLERNGLLVPAQDHAALARAIGRLAGDAALRERMGQAGRAWALKYGTVDAMGGAYQRLYLEPRA
jgi:glycosyltransferase involved in cell wall biosynthesis